MTETDDMPDAVREDPDRPGPDANPVSTQAQCQWHGSDSGFARAFRYQYLITKDHINLPGFQVHSVGAHNVLVGAGLKVCRLVAKGGTPVGLVFGIAVGPGGLLQERLRLPVRAEAPDFFDHVERFIKHLAGRYGVILQAQGKTRFYCDPVGMIGAVYEPTQRRLAASPLLAIDRPVAPHPLYDHDLMEQSGGKYSLFHTKDAHTRRLNPNCHLDLETFTETRFWPRNEVFDCDPATYGALYDEMAETTAFVIGEIARYHTTALPLSGGQDSRLIAAMAQEHLPKFRQFFTQVHNQASRVDAGVAAEICDLLGVPHEIFDWRNFETPKDQIESYTADFKAAIGYDAPLPAELEKGLAFGVEDGDVVLRGHQTDLLRAVFHFRPQRRAWKKIGWQIKRLLIVPMKQFDDKVKQRFTPDFAEWQDGLPEQAKAKAVDFMFLEVYYSATLGATFPAASRNFFMSPFNSRRMIELSLRIDDHYRRDGYAVNDLLWRLNPKLAQIPFDSEVELVRKSAEPGLTTETVQLARIEKTDARTKNLSPRRKSGTGSAARISQAA